MRQVEIMDNLDLNKVLEELRARDRKLATYKNIERDL